MNPLIPSFARKIYLAIRLFSEKRSYLIQTGYINSKINKSLLDVTGDPVPWMCYPMIEFLKERITKEMAVFEYGSGMSTLFFSNKTKSVISVEYDKVWFDKVKELTSKRENVDLVYRDVEDTYSTEIENHSKKDGYDIIVIDGRKRNECAINAFDSLSKSGVIIWDDSNRDRYDDGINFYLKKGFKKLTFSGLKPTGFGMNKTSVLYRPDNCLNL